MNTQENLCHGAWPFKQNTGAELPLVGQIPKVRMQIDTATPQTLQMKAQLMTSIPLDYERQIFGNIPDISSIVSPYNALT